MKKKREKTEREREREREREKEEMTNVERQKERHTKIDNEGGKIHKLTVCFDCFTTCGSSHCVE